MAEKELLILSKARDLMLYTRSATKPKTGDVDARNVREALQKIASLDDAREIKRACAEMAKTVDKTGKGFSKAAFRDFGIAMRDATREILRSIHAANNANMRTQASLRVERIDDILANCGLLHDLILICLDCNVIDSKKAGVWSAKVMDVRNMALAWRKSSEAKAKEQENALLSAATNKMADLLSARSKTK